MKPSQGYYCLVQYCPDLSRLEAANIGVLLFCPERHFLKVRTARNTQRIRHFFGREGHDWARIKSFQIGIEERLAVENSNILTLQNLERFIGLLANKIQISPPRPMRVTDPEKDLNQLFEELVVVKNERGEDERVDVKKILSDRFSDAGLDPKIRKDIPVTVPVFNREIRVPFGFRNGTFNLIQPVRFQSKETDQTFKTACRYAVEGRSLYENPDPKLGKLRLVVVGGFRSKGADTQISVNRILKEYNVQLFPTHELDRLIDEIRRTGKTLANPA